MRKRCPDAVRTRQNKNSIGCDAHIISLLSQDPDVVLTRNKPIHFASSCKTLNRGCSIRGPHADTIIGINYSLIALKSYSPC